MDGTMLNFCRFSAMAILMLLLGHFDQSLGQGGDGQPRRGGHLILGTSKTMTTPHPFIGSRSVSASIKESMYQSLYAL